MGNLYGSLNLSHNKQIRIMETSMNILYKELQQREKELEGNLKDQIRNNVLRGRLHECKLTIVRVQQLILKQL